MKNGLTAIAKRLRRDSTDVERILWWHLRAGRLHGLKFKRQQPIGPYIVDFVCFGQNLIIELDGGQHADAVEKDAARTRWLESQGFTVLRFWNNDVLNNVEGVLVRIMAALPPSPHPLPSRERG